MTTLNQRYIRLLEFELDDLEDDVQGMLNCASKRHGTHEISEYVFKENHAVLERQRSSIEEFRELLEALSVDEYDSIDSLIKDILVKAKKRIQRHDGCQCTLDQLERKLRKAEVYLKGD